MSQMKAKVSVVTLVVVPLLAATFVAASPTGSDSDSGRLLTPMHLLFAAVALVLAVVLIWRRLIPWWANLLVLPMLVLTPMLWISPVFNLPGILLVVLWVFGAWRADPVGELPFSRWRGHRVAGTLGETRIRSQITVDGRLPTPNPQMRPEGVPALEVDLLPFGLRWGYRILGLGVGLAGLFLVALPFLDIGEPRGGPLATGIATVLGVVLGLFLALIGAIVLLRSFQSDRFLVDPTGLRREARHGWHLDWSQIEGIAIYQHREASNSVWSTKILLAAPGGITDPGPVPLADPSLLPFTHGAPTEGGTPLRWERDPASALAEALEYMAPDIFVGIIRRSPRGWYDWTVETT